MSRCTPRSRYLPRAVAPSKLLFLSVLAAAPLLVAPSCASDRFELTQTSGLSTSEPRSIDYFSIRLVQEPTHVVRVQVRSSDPTEATVFPSELTFYPGERWHDPSEVAVFSVDDSVADGPRDYTIELLPAESEDPYYAGQDPQDVTGTTADDDVGVSQPSGEPGAVVMNVSGNPKTLIEVDGYGNVYVRFPSGVAAVRKILASGGGEYFDFDGNVGDAPTRNGLATDLLGFVYVWQPFQGTLQLGNHSLTARAATDAFIAKYHADGTVMDARLVPGDAPEPGFEEQAWMMVGPLGEVLWSDGDHHWYLSAAALEVTSDAPTPAGTESWWPLLLDASGSTLYTAGETLHNVSRDGTLSWSRTVPTTDGGWSRNEVAVGVSGPYYLIGTFEDTITLGKSTLSHPGHDQDAWYLAAMSSDGEILGGTLAAEPTAHLHGVSVNAEHQVAIGGSVRVPPEDPEDPHEEQLYAEKLNILQGSVWHTTGFADAGRVLNAAFHNLRIDPMGYVAMNANQSPVTVDDEADVIRLAP